LYKPYKNDFDYVSDPLTNEEYELISTKPFGFRESARFIHFGRGEIARRMDRDIESLNRYLAI
jgi:hypothetical protein